MSKQKERALAHIEKIEWIKDIEGADNIALAGVLGWVLIIKKGEFKVGEKCVYIEIDSLCPAKDERFEFLANKKFKVKTMKLNKFNVISQGLALPVTMFPEVSNKAIGTDVTKDLNITYYSEEDRKRKSNKPKQDAKYNSMFSRMKAKHPKFFKSKLNKYLMKRKWGKKLLFIFFGRKKDKPLTFPSFITKTDETRCENIPFILEVGKPYVVTEKLDGTSATYYVTRKSLKSKKFTFGVCSRNIVQKNPQQQDYHMQTGRTETNSYWDMAFKYYIEDKLTAYALKNNIKTLVLQGEIIGEGIQKNPYKLKGKNFYPFNLYIDGVRIPTQELEKFCIDNGFSCVPILNYRHTLPKTMEELKLESEGHSVINKSVKREGLVYRTQDGQDGFKNVSREYLLKHS
jgi:hypothetical protein